MKKKYMLILLIFLLTVGFASVSTTLVMNGTIGVAHKKSDFNVIFSSVIVNGNSAIKATISENKRTITFETNKLSTVGDKVRLIYKVKNNSTQYDANVNVNCIGVNEEYLRVESEFAGHPLTEPELISAQEVRMGSVDAELIKVGTGNITCTLNVEGEERDTILDYSVCKYSNGTQWNFSNSNGEQEFKVPCAGEYRVELWGSTGRIGENIIPGSTGWGSYTAGNINFDRDLKLYLYVGAPGQLGGGSGEASGGGATDIRLVNGNWDSFDSLKSRIMVAAGGGGGMYHLHATLVAAGHAGGLVGYSANATIANHQYTTGYSGSGASQKAGGTTGVHFSETHPYQSAMTGSFGKGGYDPMGYSSGGGGGYYGGGHGIHPGGTWSGGGGGSSFISGHAGCNAIAKNSTSSSIIHTGQPNHYSGYVFTNTKMIDGAGYVWTNVRGAQEKMPTATGGYFDLGVGNYGYGYARITLINAG